MIEMNVAIICACLPMCRLPLAYIFPSILGSTVKSSPFNSEGSDPRSAAYSGCKSRDGPAKSGSGSTASWTARDDEEKALPTNFSTQVTRATSEEIMLRPLSEASVRLDGVPEEEEHEVEQRKPRNNRDSGIRKTTWFEMRCEDQKITPGQAL